MITFAAPDAIVVSDERGRIILWTTASERIFGYTVHEAIGRELPLLLISEKNREVYSKKLEELKNQGTIAQSTFEFAAVKKGGAEFQTEISLSLFPVGGKLHTAGILRDISGRKRTEGRLREAELRFHTLFEQSPYGVVVVDPETELPIEFNTMAHDQIGLTRNEFSQLRISDYEVGQSPDEKKAIAGKLRKIGRARFEARQRTKHGEMRNFLVKTQPMILEGRTVLHTIWRDITEEKKVEQTLRQSEEKYRNLFENASDAIFIVDSELGYRDANKKALDLLGYSKEELLSMKIFDIIPPEQVPRSALEFEKLKSHGSYGNFTGKVRTKDGRWLDIEVSSTAITDGGNIIGSHDIMRDITERKKMEDELLKTQKLESISLLAGGLAHDFNNLITGIMGNVSLVKMQTRPEDKAYKRLENAEKASLRAKELSQQLLTFAKGGAPVKKTVSVGTLIRESAEFALRGSNVRCEFAIPEGLWPVYADPGQIGQVISNLIMNADQAMPGGGVIQVHAENVVVGQEEAAVVGQGKYIKITIQDHGVGIAAENLQKIFDPYFTARQEGSGLGLSISYSIMKRHGGHIAVESRLGEGSTFQVFLPASDSGMDEEGPDESIPLQSGGRILVMDDDEIVRDVAAEILKEAGYDVEDAPDGQEAISLYEAALSNGRRFDAVIMDLTIPGGMGGKEAIGELKKLDPGIKAIVTSGYSHDPIMSNFREYGFCGVVVKPFKISELSEAVQKALKVP